MFLCDLVKVAREVVLASGPVAANLGVVVVVSGGGDRGVVASRGGGGGGGDCRDRHAGLRCWWFFCLLLVAVWRKLR